MTNNTATTKKTTSKTAAKKTETKTPAFTLGDFINDQPVISKARRGESSWDRYISRKKFFEANTATLVDIEGRPTAVRKALDRILYAGTFHHYKLNKSFILIEIKPTKDALDKVNPCVLFVNLDTMEAKQFNKITEAKREVEKMGG